MSAKDGEVKGLLEEEPSHNSILGNFPVPAEVASAGKEDSENAEETEQMHYPKVHLFFSFDIVNSTMYKALTGNWPLVIRSLLEDIRSRVNRIDALQASYLWRVIGDEMIFVLPIQSEAVLVDAVDAIFEVTQRVSISLRSGRFFDLLVDQSISFAKSFRYDETDNNPMVKKYFSRLRMEQQRDIGANECELAKSMFFAKKALPKIVLDRNLRPKIDYFKKFLTGELMVTESEPYAHPLELHCAVVCCDVQNRKVLITHRSSEHTTNPGKWEFGCAKVGSGDALIQTVTHHYKTAFGIDIELVLDQSRNDQQPIPLAIYELKKRQNNIVKGVILVAKVREPISPEAFRPEGEHDRICWIGKDELENYSADDTVNDFHNTLKKVFEHFDSYFPKEGATNAK